MVLVVCCPGGNQEGVANAHNAVSLRHGLLVMSYALFLCSWSLAAEGMATGGRSQCSRCGELETQPSFYGFFVYYFGGHDGVV